MGNCKVPDIFGDKVPGRVRRHGLFQDIDTISEYQTNFRKIMYELKQIIDKNNINKESNKRQEESLEDKMYKSIVSERNREDVAR